MRAQPLPDMNTFPDAVDIFVDLGTRRVEPSEFAALSWGDVLDQSWLRLADSVPAVEVALDLLREDKTLPEGVVTMIVGTVLLALQEIAVARRELDPSENFGEAYERENGESIPQALKGMP